MNKKNFCRLASLLIFGIGIAVPFDSYAVKAKPGIVEYSLPDGTTVPVRLYGDERAHCAATPDGVLLLENSEGFLEYAMKDTSGNAKLSGNIYKKGVAAMDAGKELFAVKDYFPLMSQHASKSTKGVREAKTRASNFNPDSKYVYSTCAFPTKGEPHSIVVLVEYQDVKFSMADPHDYYEDYLNGDDFTRNGGTGSCRKFFIDSSKGVFAPTYDLYGPVLLSERQSYYGGNSGGFGTDEPHAHEMVIEAVKQLDPTVDFSQYDHNNDGYVDSIYVIYAGKGEADGGGNNTVWPHSWELEAARVNLVADGVKINSYGCSNELSGRTPVGIGTFVHEFGHVMGLPDLYNTNNSYDFTTPGAWSLMDDGSYNNDTRTPPFLSSFERYSLGWIQPEEILCSDDYELENLGDSGFAYMMTSENNPDEFFLLENRQLKDWDAFLPHHGMLIWHIDFYQNLWDRNTPNNVPTHQCVNLVKADNLAPDFYNDSYTGDPYPGTAKVTEFSTTTRPALKTWTSKELNVTSISDIKEVQRLVTFHATATEDRSNKESGIEDIVNAENDVWATAGWIHINGSTSQVYDISGRLIGMVSQDRPLEVDRGIYIVNGKKLMVR